jgi:hypothetical protein
MTGLIRYDAMCTAIAECHTVDEVKEIRDKARALEVYAQQALNREAERKACEIRIRAERKVGGMLRDMKQNGQRHSRGGDHAAMSHPPTLPELGISRDQCSQWQQLAAIPEDEFEETLAREDKPSTEGMVNARILRKAPKPHIDPDALWVWGRLKEFEQLIERIPDPKSVRREMTNFMREDTERISGKLSAWISGLV